MSKIPSVDENLNKDNLADPMPINIPDTWMLSSEDYYKTKSYAQERINGGESGSLYTNK